MICCSTTSTYSTDSPPTLWINDTLKVCLVAFGAIAALLSCSTHFFAIGVTPYVVTLATIGLLTAALLLKLAVDHYKA